MRNRVKRRIREVARALYPEILPGHDIVLIARPPAAKASYSDLATALIWLADRAGLRSGAAGADGAIADQPE